jgi:hypothetical protein
MYVGVPLTLLMLNIAYQIQKLQKPFGNPISPKARSKYSSIQATIIQTGNCLGTGSGSWIAAREAVRAARGEVSDVNGT